MKLGLEAIGGLAAARIIEGDPIPPENRVLPHATSRLETLYREQAPRLLRFFGRRSERQDAADLLQETFVRLAVIGNRSDSEIDRPEAYVSQVATNLLRNRARDAYNRATALHHQADETLSDPTDLLSALEARDMLNRLQDAMMRLSPKTREIFMAHRLDGATYAEIATRTGLRIKGVEWHMSKAIAHLHRAIGARR